MPLRKRWLTVRFCFVLVGAVAALAEPGGSQPVSSPAPTGTHRVGTLSLRLVDASRNDPFLANGTKRELMVRFWYPALPGQGCRLAEYTASKVWAHLSEVSGIPLPAVRTNSCLDALVANGRHPVLLFSHGFTGMFSDSTFLFEDLASRGYVLASIAHTYESTAIEFPDGRVVQSAFGSYLNENSLHADEPSLRFARSVRLADLKFVLDELQRLSRVPGPLAGKLDMSRVGVMGHSLGGEVSLASLQRETRLRAGVLLDAAVSGESAAGTSKPILILAAGRQQWSDAECRLWHNLSGTRLAVNLRGAEHLTLSDAIWLLKDVPSLAVPPGTMGPEKTITALRSLVAGFFDEHLRGSPANPLSNVRLPDYRDAVVTTQNQPLCHEGSAILRGELR